MISTIYNVLILNPLRKLYFHGPTLNGWGFWGSKTRAQICYALTPTSELFWETHRAECDLLIEQHFYGIQVSVESLLHVTLIYVAILLTYQRLVRPRNLVWCVPPQPVIQNEQN